MIGMTDPRFTPPARPLGAPGAMGGARRMGGPEQWAPPPAPAAHRPASRPPAIRIDGHGHLPPTGRPPTHTVPWAGAHPSAPLLGDAHAPARPLGATRSDLPMPENDLDADLAKLVRRTSLLRQGFYSVVLLVALAGQVSGAVEALHIPLAAAIPAVAALELGGIVVLGNADVRRRLGERAVASRILSVAIAAGAVTFNWLAHRDHLLGGFFAGMSALGYLVWLMHTENQRRDRLRVKGDLPPTTPAYELGGHWLRHPWLTLRARAAAKSDPRLGLYDSLAFARAEVRREHRQTAIAKVLHRKIRAAVDPGTADIAAAVYDLDEIAVRLAASADYDGLTAILAADLAPARIAPTMSTATDAHPPTGETGETPAQPPAHRGSRPPKAPARTSHPDLPPEPPTANAPARPAAPPARKPQPPTPKAPAPRPDGRADIRLVWSGTIRRNAAELRRAFPGGLPTDEDTGKVVIRRIRAKVEDGGLGWSKEKALPAVQAYLAGADLADDDQKLDRAVAG